MKQSVLNNVLAQRYFRLQIDKYFTGENLWTLQEELRSQLQKLENEKSDFDSVKELDLAKHSQREAELKEQLDSMYRENEQQAKQLQEQGRPPVAQEDTTDLQEKIMELESTLEG